MTTLTHMLREGTHVLILSDKYAAQSTNFYSSTPPLKQAHHFLIRSQLEKKTMIEIGDSPSQQIAVQAPTTFSNSSHKIKEPLNES